MRIIKVPSINALGKQGPEKAPNLILSELKKNYLKFDRLDLEEIHVDNSNIKESEGLIYKNAKEEFERQDKIVFIGGDHSISYSIVKAFNDVFSDSFLIVFDAHADCMKPMKEPTHEEWLRAVVDSGFKPENIVLIGARKIEPEERRFLHAKKIKYFSEIYDLEAVADYITERASGKDVYVSIDIDVLEPAVAPAVNYPEPLGLTSRELFYLLRRIFFIPGLKAIDIVEVVPEIDKNYNFRTIKVAAKILEEFLKKAGG